jgi:curli biogenesis system outer membrane secretion channel CsgG
VNFFGSPYSLGGVDVCGLSFFMISSGRSDPLMGEAVRFSILEVGSCDSFLYAGSSSRDLTLLF